MIAPQNPFELIPPCICTLNKHEEVDTVTQNQRLIKYRTRLCFRQTHLNKRVSCSLNIKAILYNEKKRLGIRLSRDNWSKRDKKRKVP